LGYGLACCAIEMIASARHTMTFRVLVLRSFAPAASGHLMIVAGTVSIKMVAFGLLWEQMAEPKWVISMGQCANLAVSSMIAIIPYRVWIPLFL